MKDTLQKTAILLFCFFILFWGLAIADIGTQVNLIGRTSNVLLYLHCGFVLASLTWGILYHLSKKEDLQTNISFKNLVFYTLWFFVSLVFGSLLFTFFDIYFGYLSDDLILHKLVIDFVRILGIVTNFIIIFVPYNIIMFVISLILLNYKMPKNTDLE